MGFGQYDVDKARRILPKNAVPKVTELNSNFSIYLAEINPETAGESMESIDCGSVADVAEAFKPELEFELKKLSNLGGEQVDEDVATVKMKYGETPREIMNDFLPENVVVKTKNSDGDRVLLNQQIDYHTLDDLTERLRDQKFAKLFNENKEGLIETLGAEIERIKSIKEDIEFDESYGSDE